MEPAILCHDLDWTNPDAEDDGKDESRHTVLDDHQMEREPDNHWEVERDAGAGSRWGKR